MDGEVELLGERIAEQAAHLDAATHRLLADLREFDARGGWHTQGAVSCAQWLSWRVGWDLVTARDRVRVARKLGEFPATDDALRRGELSYSKVRAILRVATPANEAMLLECARLSTASQLENLTRKYARVKDHDKDACPRDDEQRRYVRRHDTYDGMVKIEAVLHPEEAELVWTMLDHAAKQLVRDPQLPPASVPPPVLARGASAESHVVADPTIPDAVWPSTAHQSDDLELSTATQITALTAFGAPDARVCWTRDSAEAITAPDLDRVDRSPSGTDISAAHPTDDSAASGTVFDTATVRASGTGTAAGRTDDSAEAAGVFDTATVCATGTGTIAGRADDSAEAPAVCGLAGASGSCPAPGPAGDGSAALRESVPTRPASELRQAADAAKRAFNRADALLVVAHAYLCGDRPNRTPIDVMVTIPLSDLREAATDPAAVGCLGASCIAAETARRLSCDAGVIEVVEDAHGVPLSVGRKRRTLAGSMKRALLKRDTACTYPGCNHRIFLEAHHVRHWADGGETSLLNSALLCSLHHRYVHEYGYVIEMGADQRPQFRDPRGRVVAAVPARPALPDLGWPRIRADNEALEIDAETLACEWDGTPMRYGTVVDQLVVVDGLT